MQAAPEMVEKPGDTSLSKLKMLYIQAKELSESEVRYVWIVTEYVTLVFKFSYKHNNDFSPSQWHTLLKLVSSWYLHDECT